MNFDNSSTVNLPGIPAILLHWYKDDERVDPRTDSRISIEYDGKEEYFTLTVLEATPQDEGFYILRINDGMGTPIIGFMVYCTGPKPEEEPQDKPKETELVEKITKTETVSISEDTTVDITDKAPDKVAEVVAEREGVTDVDKKTKVISAETITREVVTTEEFTEILGPKTVSAKVEPGEVISDAIPQKAGVSQEEVKTVKKINEVSDAKPMLPEESPSVWEEPNLEVGSKPAVVDEPQKEQEIQSKEPCKPSFVVAPEPVVFVEGEEIQLSCRVKG